MIIFKAVRRKAVNFFIVAYGRNRILLFISAEQGNPIRYPSGAAGGRIAPKGSTVERIKSDISVAFVGQT
jgi:hypothetical protein